MPLAATFKIVGRTPIINVFMFSVVGHYTIGTTTLKDKFSVVESIESKLVNSMNYFHRHSESNGFDETRRKVSWSMIKALQEMLQPSFPFLILYSLTSSGFLFFFLKNFFLKIFKFFFYF